VNKQSCLVLILVSILFLQDSSTMAYADREGKTHQNCNKLLTGNVIKLDLSSADGYSITDFDLLLKVIRKLKLNSDKILLRAFSGSRVEVLLGEGNDRTFEPSMTYAYTLKEIEENEKDADHPSIFQIAYENRIPAIAIYDKSQMIHLTGWQYEFAYADKKSALLAVLLLVW
jgi:hypothetical protein